MVLSSNSINDQSERNVYIPCQMVDVGNSVIWPSCLVSARGDVWRVEGHKVSQIILFSPVKPFFQKDIWLYCIPSKALFQKDMTPCLVILFSPVKPFIRRTSGYIVFLVKPFSRRTWPHAWLYCFP